MEEKEIELIIKELRAQYKKANKGKTDEEVDRIILDVYFKAFCEDRIDRESLCGLVERMGYEPNEEVLDQIEKEKAANQGRTMTDKQMEMLIKSTKSQFKAKNRGKSEDEIDEMVLELFFDSFAKGNITKEDLIALADKMGYEVDEAAIKEAEKERKKQKKVK